MENKVQLLQISPIVPSACVAAWASTSEEMGLAGKYTDLHTLFAALKEVKQKSPEDLIRFLLRHGHETPLEHNIIQFIVTSDVATHIQMLKHRVGVSINTESARYKQLTYNYYTPPDFIPIFSLLLRAYSNLGFLLYNQCLYVQEHWVGRKRAKESARYFHTYNKQLNYVVTFNFRSFMHFYLLRADKNAQKEIDTIARRMLELIRPHEPFIAGLLDVFLEKV